LYQGRPSPLEGGVFKRAWFDGNRYDEPPANPIRIVQSWDTGQKENERNDPSVCTTWAETKTEYFLLHVHRDRMEWPALRRTAESLALSFKPNAVLIEDKSSGTSLIQDLKINTKLPVVAVEPLGDKVIRGMAVSPLAEAGRVRLPRIAAWLTDYESELFSFPSAVHDDQADSTSQALAWMGGVGRHVNLMDYGWA
jgi:predicted phage terminase large subunit-like protein